VQVFEEFLFSARDAQVIENGAVAFDLADAKYSISGGYNKCLLQLWSAERNVVRRVLDAQIKNDLLKLLVQRLGQNKPAKLEICRHREALSFGILWLELCRRGQARRSVVEGVKVFIPPACSSLIRERMACLSQEAAKMGVVRIESARARSRSLGSRRSRQS